MMLHGTCKQCHGQMAVLDILLEGYDLICTRCGQREIINNGLTRDHMKPKTEPRYFSLRSLSTRFRSNSRYP